MGSYLHTFLHIPYTYLHRPYTENVKGLTGLTVKPMMSQAMKEYLENMYKRDMSDDEKIIARLDTLIDLTQETLDVMRMILANQNQNQAYLLAGIKQDIDLCNRIGCNHHIDYHKLFGGCQVSECECEQFDRKENNA